MRGIAVAAGLALAALALANGAAATHGGGHLDLAVTTARDLGCSNDSSGADLRVSVYVDGRLALRTAKGKDSDQPVFASAVRLTDPGAPFQVTIQIHEAEPGPFFGLDTDWIPCDAAPGAAREFAARWSGGVQAFTARGDAHDAAEATVVLGSGAPMVPSLQATSAAGHIDLSWATTAATPSIVTQAFAAGEALPAGTRSHRLDGLCDGDWYQARLVLQSGAWLVGGPTQGFQAADVAPEPPRVLSAQASAGNWSLSWESRTTHDIARYDILVGPDAAVPALPRASREPFSDWSRQSDTVPSRPGDAFVWVRAVDRGGNAALSPAFAIGSPAQSPSASASWHRFETCAVGAAAIPESPTEPEESADPFAAGPPPSASSPSTFPPSSTSPSTWQDGATGSGAPRDLGLPGTSPPSVPRPDPGTPSGQERAGSLEPFIFGGLAVAGLAVFAFAISLLRPRR